MTHTPTPWAINDTNTDCPQIKADIKGNGYYANIVSVVQRDEHPIHGGGINPQEAIANAQFIVTACNAHEELVAALKAANAELDRVGGFYAHVKTQIAQAVAKAEKGG